MKQYHFNVTLLAKFDVEAASREEAERIIRGICEGGVVKVTEAADNEETITGTCDVEGELDFVKAE
jgi:hypothetical protein